MPKPFDISAERSANADRMAKKRAAGRNVDIPKCKNPRRRASTKFDLKKYLTTYDDVDNNNQPAKKPALFYTKFSPEHNELIKTVQDIILRGGVRAIAEPRGFGKDTLLEKSIEWGICHGHIMSPLLIGSSAKFIEDRDFFNIKCRFERSELLCEDFPELCIPIRALEGASQRANTIQVNGELTPFVWQTDRLIFPKVKGYDTGGAKLLCMGMEGGVRGNRSDFWVLTDPEKEDSAASVVERAKLIKILDKGIINISYPGKRKSGIYLCTIIEKNCIADIYTDRKKKPAWGGRRKKALITFPDAKDTLWQQYIDMRQEGGSFEDADERYDPDGRRAHKFYLDNRAEMDAGAEVLWPDNYVRTKMPDKSQYEVSNLENIFNYIADFGWESFWSELQNEPMDVASEAGALTAKQVQSHLSGYQKRIVPAAATRIGVGIDVGAKELHVTIGAAMECATTFIIDYPYIKTYELDGIDTQTQAGKDALERVILTQLRVVRSEILAGFMDENDEPREFDMACVDSGSSFADVVYKFVLESGPRWRATKGHAHKQGFTRYNNPKKLDENYRTGLNYYGHRIPELRGGFLWHVDVDKWKEYTQLRFLQSDDYQSFPGATLLYGSSPKLHSRFASHVVAEKFDVEKNRWLKIGSSNHWLDSTVLMHVANAMPASNHTGIRLRSEAEVVAPTTDKTSTKGMNITQTKQALRNQNTRSTGTRLRRKNRSGSAW